MYVMLISGTAHIYMCIRTNFLTRNHAIIFVQKTIAKFIVKITSADLQCISVLM